MIINLLILIYYYIIFIIVFNIEIINKNKYKILKIKYNSYYYKKYILLYLNKQIYFYYSKLNLNVLIFIFH